MMPLSGSFTGGRRSHFRPAQEQPQRETLEQSFGMPLQTLTDLVCGDKRRYAPDCALQRHRAPAAPSGICRESLLSYGLVVNKRNLILSPALEAARERKAVSPRPEHREPPLAVFQLRGNEILCEEAGGATPTIETDLERFLELLNDIEQRDPDPDMLAGFRNVHLYGVPPERQRLAHVLLASEACFISKDAYRAVEGSTGAFKEPRTALKQVLGWSGGEFVRLMQAQQEMRSNPLTRHLQPLFFTIYKHHLRGPSVTLEPLLGALADFYRFELLLQRARTFASPTLLAPSEAGKGWQEFRKRLSGD